MQLQGVGIGSGLAIGPVLRMPEPLPEPADRASTLGVDVETARADAALAVIASVIRDRGQRAGGTAKAVLDAQALMVEDPTLTGDVRMRIVSGTTAERAVFEAFVHFKDLMLATGGALAERANDLEDVSRRVIAELRGAAVPAVPDPDFPFVLYAHDLAPADTALLDLDRVIAVVTSEGGPTSHTAILAREKSLVAVVGVSDALALTDGSCVIVDAAAGTVTVDPDEQTVAKTRERITTLAAQVAAPRTVGALADGTAVPLLANLGSANSSEEAIVRGAEGVGLFRTEFLFLDVSEAPTVAAQQKHYTRLLTAFPRREVVVRVLDAGSDKPLSFLSPSHEANPALGLRGLRALRANERVLREQLTALAAADAETEAELWVMAPMVATVDEARYFKSMTLEHGLKVAGVMIEIPSAALLADRILAECDFVSVGTNDLTQYVLAADRMLGSVAHYQDPWHPAVLRLIDEVGRAAHASGKPVGICGEAAADPLLAVVLVGLGATSLSMSSAALDGVRAQLRRFTLAQARDLAGRALAADSAEDAHTLVLAASSAAYDAGL